MGMEKNKEKGLSPIKREQVKKWLIFSALGLIFALSMWFIFKPSEGTQALELSGLNDVVPQASVEQLEENKLKAYELGTYEESLAEQRKEMGRLSDYFAEEENAMLRSEEDQSSSKIEGSLQQYESNSQLLASFYEAENYYEEEIDYLRGEVESLRMELNNREQDIASEEERQLALMEKSYQMAAKYMPTVGAGINSSGSASVASQNEVSVAQITELPQMEVVAERKSVVSMLEQPMTDSAFIADYGASERNLGFLSMATVANKVIPRNTLKVVVDKTTTLQEGSFVVLRLSEDAQLQGIRLARNAPLVAQAKIEGSRMRLYVRSVETDGRIFSVALSAFDLDGQEGIAIPGIEEVQALKETAATVGGSMGTSFTFASSAKDQVLSELARGTMQGASQLLQKKLREIKVRLKGGHQLYLVQSK
nr:conjugative transposon protein TraM [Porphyromonas levii]